MGVGVGDLKAGRRLLQCSVINRSKLKSSNSEIMQQTNNLSTICWQRKTKREKKWSGTGAGGGRGGGNPGQDVGQTQQSATTVFTSTSKSE